MMMSTRKEIVQAASAHVKDGVLVLVLQAVMQVTLARGIVLLSAYFSDARAGAIEWICEHRDYCERLLTYGERKGREWRDRFARTPTIAAATPAPGFGPHCAAAPGQSHAGGQELRCCADNALRNQRQVHVSLPPGVNDAAGRKGRLRAPPSRS